MFCIQKCNIDCNIDITADIKKNEDTMLWNNKSIILIESYHIIYDYKVDSSLNGSKLT